MGSYYLIKRNYKWEKTKKKRTGCSKNPEAWSLDLGTWILHGSLVWQFQPGIFLKTKKIDFCGLIFLFVDIALKWIFFWDLVEKNFLETVTDKESGQYWNTNYRKNINFSNYQGYIKDPKFTKKTWVSNTSHVLKNLSEEYACLSQMISEKYKWLQYQQVIIANRRSTSDFPWYFAKGMKRSSSTHGQISLIVRSTK